MSSYAKYGTRQGRTSTPQSQPIPGREAEMAPNAAGGFTFDVTPWVRLERFLILGTPANTYYTTAQELTTENAQAVIDCLKLDGVRTIGTIADISVAGRAPKQEPALFALALAATHGDASAKAALRAAFPRVVRTGTHLFLFARYATSMRGWGRFLRTLIADWYADHATDTLAYQVVKYQGRETWTHRDLFRLVHPLPGSDPARKALYTWVVKGVNPDLELDGTGALPRVAFGFAAAQRATTAKQVAALIREYGLTREMVPTEYLKDKDVLAALFAKMPLTALIRNLASLTRAGLLAPLSDTAREVVARLHNTEALSKARIHPVALYLALAAYSQGGAGGRSHGAAYTPVPSVLSALDDAFYAAFDAVVPSGLNTLVAVDTSGSMWVGEAAGCPGLTPGKAACLMALVTIRTEPQHEAIGFTTSCKPLALHAKMRLDDVIKAVEKHRTGSGTDCAQPALYARTERRKVQAIALYTDGETWAGTRHPHEALAAYRRESGQPTRLAAVAFTATRGSVADPQDAGSMDFVGWDAAAPRVMADFFGARQPTPAGNDDAQENEQSEQGE